MINKIISVVGARPNFMKVAPIHRAFTNYVSQHLESNFQHLICHTGQHYDEKMSKVFFEELELPRPDFYLGVGSGSHAEQTGKIMIAFEKVLLEEKPELVIVVGDVNSTIACSLTAKKLGIKVAHVEAGLRSFDREMPEEINRILTDSISDYLFVTEKSGLVNLKNEGISYEKIFFVGHVMMDSLIHFLPKSEKSVILNKLSHPGNLTLNARDYILVTLHRPSNVDIPERLNMLLNLLLRISNKKKIVFPVHPRTKSMLSTLNLDLNLNLILTDPLGYIDFLALMQNARLIITDSGGIQEETTYLGIPCITLRKSTERPVTVDLGTNYLLGDELDKVEPLVNEIFSGKHKRGEIPELWDGKSAERIVKIITEQL